MTSPNPDYQFSPYRKAALPSRFYLHLVVSAGEQVLSGISDILRRYTDTDNHFLAVIDSTMDVCIELTGLYPHRAENLACALIRHDSVIRLSGQFFDQQGRETYGIKLYARW